MLASNRVGYQSKTQLRNLKILKLFTFFLAISQGDNIDDLTLEANYKKCTTSDWSKLREIFVEVQNTFLKSYSPPQEVNNKINT